MKTMSVEGKNRAVTTQKLLEMKQRGEKIAMLTAYDYISAKILDLAAIDIILVGDSAANVMAGHQTTLPITLDQMIYHAQCVVRGVKNPHVVVDMPFGSYQVSVEQAVSNAVRVMKESGADSLKIEGGSEVLETIKKIVDAGIPVMGHLGLTPQSIHKLGGYSVRAKEEKEARKLIEDAVALEEAGCYALVLEKIPTSLGAEVSEKLKIPVIGIGAGDRVDGQVLVMQDMLGLNSGFKPRYLRLYKDLHKEYLEAFSSFIEDVKNGSFPSKEEIY